MTDTHDPTCAAIQPLLFAAIEGEIQGAERLEVHAHLAVCEACRSWEHGERALTALLVEDRQRTVLAGPIGARSRFYGFAAAALVASLALFLLPSAVPRGSVVQRQLGPDLDWEVASERAFAGGEIVVVPATAAVTVRLSDGVQLDAVGPARFALDVMAGGWSVSVVRGSLLAAVGERAVLSAGGDGEPLGAGRWLLSADSIARQDPHPQNPAALLAEGLRRFGAGNAIMMGGSSDDEREHMVAAEKLLRTALNSKDATVDQRRRAMFYLAASLGRQGRAAESFELEQRYLERFPAGDEASLVRFYMADHLRQTGRLDEARALFQRVLRDEGESSLGSAAVSYLDFMAQDPKITKVATQLQEGIERFGSATPRIMGGSPAEEREHLAAAEKILRGVLKSTDATVAHQRQALFYLACSVSRLGRAEESFALKTEYLERFPKGREASSVRFYMAAYLRDTGRLDEARALFQRVLRDEGELSLGSAARSYLEVMDNGVPVPRAIPVPQEPAEKLTARRPAGDAPAAGQGRYLVVPVGLHDSRAGDKGFLAAANQARTFHDGDEWAWDGEDFGALQRALRRRAPANVLFVMRPETLDIALHRRVLLLAAAIDDDWFADFAFGYLTAEDGPACERLWQRIVTVHQRGKLRGTWWQASVTTNPKSLEYENSPPPTAAAAGFRGPHYYYSVNDPDRDAVIERSLAAMRSAAVVEFTGCGDPQGIWLFDDQRNMKRELHWDYDPDRVGEDSDGAMPRLMASQFRALDLDSPVLWSGTCHSGAVCKVFVEGDIVSTFGRTRTATVHRLKPENSLALSWLAAGAASMLVPLGANHGMSVAMEVDFALRNGASLGETMKSTYDDVLLAAEGDLVLDIPEEGKPHQRGEAVMQGGGSNRILIGDPALRPFQKVDGRAENVTAERTRSGLRVTIVRAKGWQPRSWDMFGQARGYDYRILARVDLTALQLARSKTFEAKVSAVAPDGSPMRYAMRRCAIEDHQGRRYLHLQANGTRADLDRKAATIVFEVAVK